jgi:DNA-directed RNA polymerase specialized sigma24 family protein
MTGPPGSAVPSEPEKALLLKVYSRSLEYAARLLRRSRLPYDPEDLANGAVIALLSHWGVLSRRVGFPAFLERYALVVVRNAHRRLVSLGPTITLDSESLIASMTTSPSLEASILSEERIRFRELLGQLRPLETEILTWIGEGKSLEDYSLARGIDESVARSRLWRAAHKMARLTKKQSEHG